MIKSNAAAIPVKLLFFAGIDCGAAIGLSLGLYRRGPAPSDPSEPLRSRWSAARWTCTGEPAVEADDGLLVTPRDDRADPLWDKDFLFKGSLAGSSSVVVPILMPEVERFGPTLGELSGEKDMLAMDTLFPCLLKDRPKVEFFRITAPLDS
jgi:hypothetical protein